MNREEIEQQLKLSKKQNKEQRYDYLCSQFNCINYAIKLEKYTNKLQRENRELKKQLENCYCNRTDCSSRIKDSKKYDSLMQKVENQQKEFIEYLEVPIKIITEGNPTNISEYTAGKLDTLKEILSKYKEIIDIKSRNK